MRRWLPGIALSLLPLISPACISEAPRAEPCTSDGRCLSGFECVDNACLPCAGGVCEERVVTALGTGGGIACGPIELLGRVCVRIPGSALAGPITVSITRTKEIATIAGEPSLTPIYRVEPRFRLFDAAMIAMPLSTRPEQLRDVVILRTDDPQQGWTPLWGRPEYISMTATTTVLGDFVAARLEPEDAGVQEAPDGGVDAPDAGHPDARVPRPDGGRPDLGMPSLDAAQDAEPAPDAVEAPDEGPLDAMPAANPMPGFGVPSAVIAGANLDGLAWNPSTGLLILADYQSNVLMALTPPSTAPGSFYGNANGPEGLAVDDGGRIYVAEGQSRSVARIDSGNRTLLADAWQGTALNGPFDVLVRRGDGMVYFSDPGVGQAGGALGFNGLYRIDPSGAPIALEWQPRSSIAPSGLALSPDQTVLYAADLRGAAVYAFDVAVDGALGPPRMLLSTSPNPSGLAVDVQGNIYVATQVGLQVFPPTGGPAYGPAVGQGPLGDLCFGGADRRTLYGTLGRYLLVMPVTTPGAF